MPPENKEKVNMKDPNPIELKPCIHGEWLHHFESIKPMHAVSYFTCKSCGYDTRSPSEPPKPIEWPKEPSIHQYNDDFENGVNTGRRLMYMEFMLAIRAYEGRNSK